MKALCWHGHGDVRIDIVPDPKILEPTDAIVQITSSGICGSDLHLFDGFMPKMRNGDVLGHEPMGTVVEVGHDVTKLRVGDRVVVPFNIACGECFFCRKQLFACCDRTNPDAATAAKVMGHAGAGMLGSSHMAGGYAGGQAEFLRVPYADVGPIKIESDLPDEKVVFLSDIFPTGYMAAENADIEPGDVVAIWGCGPVAQFAIKSAWMLGAGRVIAIDRVPERLRMAKVHGGAEVIDFTGTDVFDSLQELTGGRGPDRCIDAVGCEAYGAGFSDVMDKIKTSMHMAHDHAHVLREAIKCCRKGGTISVPGVYVGVLDKIPMGAFMQKGLTMRSGQTHTQRYLARLLAKIEGGEIDPSFVITHQMALEDAPDGYRKFRDKKDGCVKVLLRPSMRPHPVH
jgi:threonine dehydrogenase-like Zn-dependent dehydrogenase